MSRFLIDAHLPRRLAHAFTAWGFDAVHTIDLPLGNATTDSELNRISIEERRIVVTKDADFIESFLISGKPYKLLLVSTGNIKNQALHELFEKNLHQIVQLFETSRFVELDVRFIVTHQ